MTDEERKFKLKINVDKANNKSNIAIVIIIIWLIIDILDIGINLLFTEEFNFKILFEVISLIFVVIAKIYMSNYNAKKAKIFTICALVLMIPVVVLNICDFIQNITLNIMPEIDEDEDIDVNVEFFIAYIIYLFAIYKDLAKAGNPEKYKESTDWFYEKYEGGK